ncbi:MAG: A/G-specific adenine glycosylase [Nitrospinae bacterium]|nr:A/G-specific adenine glycosylase [Nitrospinota bacterium]
MSNKPKHKTETPGLSPLERRSFRRRILSWYDREKRELPWRGENDPYRIWVSEAMLQQTRSETVRLRYPAFIERFPTLTALADAPQDAVLAEWQGLGYYGRARNLHRAAQQVVRDGGGVMPQTRDALLALPGVGPYMAGAIASIAFGERRAAIDGNALRIMSRVLNLLLPIDTPPAQKAIHEEAQALVPRARPGDFNQALMDLGARICLPKTPGCAQCPVRDLCAGHQAGTQKSLPVKTAKKPPAPYTLFQFRAERDGLVLLAQRERTGLFGGMWELPGFMLEGRHEKAGSRRLRAQCARLLGPGWRPGRELARITRTLTHRKILFVVFLAEFVGNGASPANRDGLLWASEEDFRTLAVSTAQRAAWRAAGSALAEGDGKQVGR